MSLTLGDNFSYQGAKPLDNRLKYATLADMKAVADATMYDGCLAYCAATDKTYQWKLSNVVDIDTGRWREFGAGSVPASGVTAGTLGGKVLANATSVANLADKQVRNIYAGTTDLTPGVDALPSGDIYIVYET